MSGDSLAMAEQAIVSVREDMFEARGEAERTRKRLNVIGEQLSTLDAELRIVETALGSYSQMPLFS